MKHLDKPLSLAVAWMSIQACESWWNNWNWYLRVVAYSQDDRPFVYRALVPYLSRLLENVTGVDVILCLFVVITLSGFGMYYSVRYLIRTYDNSPKADLLAFLACVVVFLTSFVFMKVYDLTTAALFTFCIALLARKKHGVFYIVFLIASVNRETTILLLVLFFIYYLYGNISRSQFIGGTLFQVVSFVVVRYLIMSHYAGNEGAVFWNDWQFVLSLYLSKKTTLLLVAIFVSFLYPIAKKWNEKPIFLRTAFASLFPIFVILHIFFGMPFETRVFAEIVPTIVVLASVN